MTETGEHTLEPATTSSGRGIGTILAVLGLVGALTVAALALDSNTPAAAEGLQQFDSCAELQAFTEELIAPVESDILIEEESRAAAEGSSGAAAPVVDDVSAPAPAAAPPTSTGQLDSFEADGESTAAATGADTGATDTGGTNTVVEGVDEIDVIDRVAPDRLLVSRQGALALVDLDDLTVVAELRGVPYDARVSVVDGLLFVAGSSLDGLGTEVRRVRIDGDAFVEQGTWTTPGYLLDARRTGDQLHVVAVDQPYDVGVVPFEDGPVPCDQIWRPVDPAVTPAATLIATLPGSGELTPTAATAVTGSAGTILVTGSAAYVATTSYDDEGNATTGLHRFDLATLAPTGSGVVPGTLAGPFAINEFEGNLRVATSASGGFGIGRPIPIEGDAGVGVGAPAEDSFGGAEPAVEDSVDAEPAVDVATPTAAAQEEEPADPPITVEPLPDTTIVEDPPITIEPQPNPTVPETTVPETTVPETTVPETTVPEPPIPGDESALAEVFVLDTEGDLDVIGSTGRFGREFETIHGVRFVGDLAYVVTFLQTDPFWVIDLSDPTAPAIVGELQVPGFSGYLHPVADGLVVGFGPDGNGAMAARLFDVSDPATPVIVDELRLGDDSPVAFDHHAFVSLDDTTFAVPVTDYPEYIGGGCEVIGEPVPLPEPLPVEPDGGTGVGGGTTGSTGIAVDELPQRCVEPTPVGGSTGAAVLAVDDGRLELVERATTDRSDVYAERVVQRPGGSWLLLSYDRLVDVADGTELVLPTA